MDQTIVPTDDVDLAHVEEDPTDVLHRVTRTGSRFVLTWAGRPLAALVPVDDLARLQRLDAEWEEDMAVFHEIGKAFADVDPAEIERETATALADVRAKMRAEREAIRSKGRTRSSTNVLLRGIAGEDHPTSPSGAPFWRWQRRWFAPVLSEHIDAEPERTLSKPYDRARLSPSQIQGGLGSLRRRGRVVDVTVDIKGAATHTEDDLVLATAASAGTPYLVTADRQRLALGRFRGATILSPTAFLAVLAREAAPGP